MHFTLLKKTFWDNEVLAIVILTTLIVACLFSIERFSGVPVSIRGDATYGALKTPPKAVRKKIQKKQPVKKVLLKRSSRAR